MAQLEWHWYKQKKSNDLGMESLVSHLSRANSEPKTDPISESPFNELLDLFFGIALNACNIMSFLPQKYEQMFRSARFSVSGESAAVPGDVSRPRGASAVPGGQSDEQFSENF